MSAFTLALGALAFGSVSNAQQAGTLTPEKHPALSVSTCTTGGTCTSKTQSVVLDGNWRWLHSTTGSTDCYTCNTFYQTLCPDGVTCATNYALDGADYTGTYGIKGIRQLSESPAQDWQQCRFQSLPHGRPGPELPALQPEEPGIYIRRRRQPASAVESIYYDSYDLAYEVRSESRSSSVE